MWPNPQETSDLVTFTEEIFNWIFCAVKNELKANNENAGFVY